MAIDRDLVLRSAAKHAARNRYKQAIAEYQKLLEHSPDDARLLLKVGDLQAKMHAYARAVDTYARAGRIYADGGFAAKAVAVYKQVQQLIDHDVPHLADYFLFVYPTLANLYQELRLPVEAMGMYDAYALMLARCGRLREAATVLGIVVERGGDNPLMRLRLAELLFEEGDESEAVTHFVAAADGLQALGRVDEAVRVMDHTFARTPDPRLACRAAQALLYRTRGDDGMQALLRLQQAFNVAPKNLEILALLAHAFEAIDQRERAFEVRKETVRIAKDQGAMDAAWAVLEGLRSEAPDDPVVASLVKSMAPQSLIPEVSAEFLPPSEPEHTVVPSPEAAPLDDLPPIPYEVLQEHNLVRHGPLESIRGFRGGGDLADAMEEAAFFASRGLFQDAVAILEEQRSRFPDDPALAARLGEIRAQAQSSCAEAQPSVLGVAEPTLQASRLSQGADPIFLETALADLEAPGNIGAETIDLKGGTLDIDDLFDAFKRGIAGQIDEGDSQMHYDLGVAYLEMGKLNAAIEAFEVAARDPVRACVSLSMVASVYRSEGKPHAAMAALHQAAQVPRKTREEEVGVHYELASLHQESGNEASAIGHFEQVVRLAPDFRDARARLQNLRSRAAPATQAEGSNDEFERAFDDLLAGPRDNEGSDR